MTKSKSDLEFLDFKPVNSLLNQMRLSMALNQRKVTLVEDVTPDSIFECIYYLYKIMDIDKITGTKKPIEILINTNGGYVEEGYILVSLIEQMKDDGYEIITTNIGKAYSMGFIISICGSKRQAFRYSRYMYHDVSFGAFGKFYEVQSTVDEINMLREIGKDIITKYTTLTREQIEAMNESRKEEFLTPQYMQGIKGVDIIL